MRPKVQGSRRKEKVKGDRAMWSMILVFGLFGLLSIGGNSRGYGQDVQEIIRTIDEQQQKIQTLTASFSQKKETSLAKDPLISRGLLSSSGRTGFISFT